MDKTVAFCILARDCEKSLEQNIKKIEDARKQFTKSYVIIVENDSKDGTKQILNEWSNRSENIIVLSEDTGQKTIPVKNSVNGIPSASLYRIEKMAGFRNKYMRYIHENIKDLDLLIVIDIDIFDFTLNIETLLAKAPSDWTAITANGFLFFSFLGKKIKTKLYYDTFAYLPYNSESDSVSFRERYLNTNDLIKRIKDQEFIPCKSSFAGIGIYKYEYLKEFYYTTVKNSISDMMEAICEHISIYKLLNNYGKCYISRELQVYYKPVKTIGEVIAVIFGYKFFIRFWEIIKHRKLI